MVVGLSEKFLGDEEIGAIESGGNGIEVGGGELPARLKSLERRTVAREVFDERLHLLAVTVGEGSLSRRAEDDPMAPLDGIGNGQTYERAGLPAVSEPHKRGECLLKLQNAGAGEIGPECISSSSGESIEMQSDFGDAGGEQRELLHDALAQ